MTYYHLLFSKHHEEDLYLSCEKSSILLHAAMEPTPVKDLNNLERVQRIGTKFILNDYESVYKSRLIKLIMLTLVFWYELQDIKYIVKCIQEPPYNFDLFNYISISESSTRSPSSKHLKY